MSCRKAACCGLEEARPLDGPSHERSQRTCSLKYDGKAIGVAMRLAATPNKNSEIIRIGPWVTPHHNDFWQVR
ncbi:hypothetical protein EU971_13000 [Yersinia pseudotuberculosis]|nr:hypothetical protein EU971_13000 [Yersinia pseudotuberculosis]